MLFRSINRELSWLEFNGRVLEEARDASLPILERLKFLAITGSNLDEFFMVRVGGLQLLRAQRGALPDAAGLTPAQQLREIGARARAIVAAQYECLAREIEPYNPLWLEEPIRPENPDAMKKLSDRVNIPLASGECNYTKYEFRDLLALQALDILQPDICVTGGLMEMKKIAAMAEACYVMVAPHNPMGPVATAVNVHFAASTPNFLILEYHPDDTSPRKDLLKEPLMVKDGYIPLPTKPGLGIELNEEAFKHYPFKRWRRGFDYRADGSVAFI